MLAYNYARQGALYSLPTRKRIPLNKQKDEKGRQNMRLLITEQLHIFLHFNDFKRRNEESKDFV
uniref:Uncharacterized protein n=1 Tax=Rhizophora mucronata TaxID=61149 RepID=A0A2P2NAM6_RHIMU